MRFPINTRQPLRHLDHTYGHRWSGEISEDLLGLVRGGAEGADDDGQDHAAADDPEL